MKRTIKTVVGYGLFVSKLERWLLRGTSAVVALHRVNPSAGAESLTMHPDELDAYCRYFKRRFDVVPLAEIVLSLERGVAAGRRLAITFDDGYRDNFTFAAPILEAHGLPATFFVVSGFIGTDTVPWWDRRARVVHPWMSWEEVRSLQARRFEIGAHTRTHVDLGATSGDEARTEILGARRDLERRLGVPVRAFAYPYGRRDNLTEANRQIVRDAGFRCCCSAFGGVNAVPTDPFHLRRIPIAPGCVSPSEFGFELALRRTVLAPRRAGARSA
ncbi:MAG: polysaccharide deacetylase family protein [Acidobacteria bacterium]|nr:polysaccharide deacetylase family protein [Acidobacteriota bacterium]